LSTLIDSGSSASYINADTAQRLQLQINPSKQSVSMALSSITCQGECHCVADLTVNGRSYPKVKLGVLKNLCSDVLLGGDFQTQHKRVMFEFCGPDSEFVIKNQDNLCAVAAASVSPTKLFENLAPGGKPVATKSRRFNLQDRNFIKSEVAKLASAEVIKPSRLPWRAQVLVVTNQKSGKKRMCLDYSQTVNIFTNLDAYPLPRIDEMVNSLASYNTFSTFDLKSAYYQIPIEESDKPYHLKLMDNYGNSTAFRLVSLMVCLNSKEKWTKLLTKINYPILSLIWIILR